MESTMPHHDDQPSALDGDRVCETIVYGAKKLSALARTQATQTEVDIRIDFVASVTCRS